MEWFNYHHLYYFWVVCKEGGFSKAAAKLRIAQSAVSLQISKLEDHLGEKLMERGPRGFSLTEAGEVTLAQAEDIFRQGNDLLQYFRSGKMRSHFHIGAIGGLSKNFQLRLLQKIIENSKIELSLEVGDVSVLVERLLNYKLDAVLSDVALAQSTAEPLVQTEIASETICLVSRIKPKKSENNYFTKLTAFGVYLPARSSPITSALIDALTTGATPPNVRGYIDDIALLRLLALETDNLVAIPKIGALREIESGELHIIHEFKKIRQNYYLVYRHKGKRHPILNILLQN